MRLVKDDPELQIQIIATNMHLLPEFGYTYKEIENDGFAIDRKIDMSVPGDTANSVVKSMGKELQGMADAYEDLKPDLIVVLGDRYEILVAVEAALIFKIPVAHISGGDITEGAYDDAIRHAITKMSHLHFPTTEAYRNRIIQMGEQPEHVWNMGSLAIDNMRHLQLMSKDEFEKSINFELDKTTVLVTFHPVTLENNSAEGQCEELLRALDSTGYKIIFTMPNSDNNGQVIIDKINDFVAKHSDKSVAFKSLGYFRYLSALQYVKYVAGNSSSGLAEVPSFHIPTINIGDRQKGRLRSKSVIDCAPNREEILEAFKKADEMYIHGTLKDVRNIYEQPDTAAKMLEIIKHHPLEGICIKKFYNLETH